MCACLCMCWRASDGGFVGWCVHLCLKKKWKSSGFCLAMFHDLSVLSEVIVWEKAGDREQTKCTYLCTAICIVTEFLLLFCWAKEESVGLVIIINFVHSDILCNHSDLEIQSCSLCFSPICVFSCYALYHSMAFFSVDISWLTVRVSHRFNFLR